MNLYAPCPSRSYRKWTGACFLSLQAFNDRSVKESTSGSGVIDPRGRAGRRGHGLERRGGRTDRDRDGRGGRSRAGRRGRSRSAGHGRDARSRVGDGLRAGSPGTHADELAAQTGLQGDRGTEGLLGCLVQGILGDALAGIDFVLLGRIEHLGRGLDLERTQTPLVLRILLLLLRVRRGHADRIVLAHVVVAIRFAVVVVVHTVETVQDLILRLCHHGDGAHRETDHQKPQLLHG